MRRAVSQLYVHILRFSMQALRWYNKSRLKRAFSSLLCPYELEYKETVEQIHSLTSVIRHIATAESQSEVRDINLELGLIRNDQTRLIERVDTMISIATSKSRFLAEPRRMIQLTVPRPQSNQREDRYQCARHGSQDKRHPILSHPVDFASHQLSA